MRPCVCDVSTLSQGAPSPRTDVFPIIPIVCFQFLWWGRKRLGWNVGEDVNEYLAEQVRVLEPNHCLPIRYRQPIHSRCT
jgi:hypothetical protein